MYQPTLIPEPALYLAASSGPAYFATLAREHGRDVRQHIWDVADMPTVIRHVDPRHDSYVSQATFRRRERRVAALGQIGLTWADLDDPRFLEHRREHGEARTVELILEAIEDAQIPAPSLIVSSGRGYHVKWLFERAVPRDALARWDPLTREIVHRLAVSLGADRACVDAARVLRLVGTLNTRTGDVARVAWENTLGGAIVRYPFDRLVDEVLEHRRRSHHERLRETQELRPRKARAADAPRPTYHPGILWWRRLSDLRRLAELRGWTEGVPEGSRDRMLFLGAVALSWHSSPASWWAETRSLARELTPTLTAREVTQYAGTTWRRLAATAAGEGERRYRYTDARIIAELEISPAEQAQLEQLVPQRVKDARAREQALVYDAARRRAAGAEPRAAYIGRAAEKAARAREMAAAGSTWPQIMVALEVSERTVARYLTQDLTSPPACIVAKPWP